MIMCDFKYLGGLVGAVIYLFYNFQFIKELSKHYCCQFYEIITAKNVLW